MEHSEKMAIKKSFTTHDVLKAFSAEFLNEDHCRQWVLKQMHGEHPSCPKCGSDLFSSYGFFEGKKVHCSICSKWFTALTNTFLSGTQFSFSEIFLLAVFISLQGIPNKIIANILRINEDTVQLWRRKFNR